MLILGLNKTTLLDYPGRVAATIFTGGCNFRCPFCQNGGLVLEPSLQDVYPEEEVLAFLKKRINVLKGVCVSGGEPTLHADLPEFIEKIKELGYQVKLDTNGYAPQVLKGLIHNGLIDYVAMDIKNSQEKYAATIGLDGELQNAFSMDRVCESVEILRSTGIDHEFRTTVVRELHTKEDILKIGEWIKGCPRYYLQQFKESDNIICQGFHEWDEQVMKEMVEDINKIPEMSGKVFLRGTEG